MFRICGQDYLETLRITEFHHHLPAYTAGSRVLCKDTIFPAHNTDGIKLALAFADRFENAVLSAQLVGV